MTRLSLDLWRGCQCVSFLSHPSLWQREGVLPPHLKPSDKGEFKKTGGLTLIPKFVRAWRLVWEWREGHIAIIAPPSGGGKNAAFSSRPSPPLLRVHWGVISREPCPVGLCGGVIRPRQRANLCEVHPCTKGTEAQYQLEKCQPCLGNFSRGSQQSNLPDHKSFPGD